MGDINGIGPEVALKAAARRWPANLELTLIGSSRILNQQAKALGLRSRPTWDPLSFPSLRWKPGKVCIVAARAAAAWIRHGVEACQSGRLDGIVTAPITKEGFQRAGILFPGHTEFIAELTKTRRYAMMLFGGPLRVVLVTRHIPIARVPRALTRNTIEQAVTLTAEALPWMGVRRARIAVCGLNPHAGEGGAIGREEITTIAPTVRALRERGLNVSGPHPADTIFHQAARGDYDAVVAMYHDQGLAPLKLIAFDCGVNVTLGLPIIRTSPDHGTAYNIAGHGAADPSSMVEAIRQAHLLAQKRNPWRTAQ